MAYKLVEEMKAHNKRVDEAFRRADKGEIINLTDLMIGKEKIEVEMAGVEHLLGRSRRK